MEGIVPTTSRPQPQASKNLGEDRSSNLDVVLELEQRRLHDVPKAERVRLDIEGVRGRSCDPVPVSATHRLVAHHLQNGTALTEIVDLLLQVKEGLPLLETLWQALTSATHTHTHTGDP